MKYLRDRSYWKSLKKKKSTCWDGCVRWGRSTKGYAFEEITYDHKFEIVGIGDTPEGTYTHCAFCGLRIKHIVYLKRLTDATFWKVGHHCVGKVGLEVTESTKRLRFRREPKPPRPKVEEPKVEKPKEMHPGIKKALEEYKKERAEEFTKEMNKIFAEAEEKKKEEEANQIRKEMIEFELGKEKESEKKEVEKEDEFNLDDIFDD